jgi:hypothetical protein
MWTTLWLLPALALADVTTMGFKDLESSTTQKLVIFHEPGNEKSEKTIELLQKLDTEGGYGKASGPPCPSAPTCELARLDAAIPPLSSDR